MGIWLRYALFSLTIPCSTLISLNLGGIWAWTTPVVAFILLPTFEAILPLNRENHVEEESKAWPFDFLLYFMLPIQYYSLYLFGLQFNLDSLNQLNGEHLGMILSLGINCGVVGINVGHELGHRKKGIEVLMGKLLLASSCYEHFFVEHNKGHHRHVATPLDPATAKSGQSVYRFWVQSLLGSFKSALKIDKEEVLLWLSLEILLGLMMGYFFNVFVTAGFFAASLVGALLLETVNYIEHYGLKREKKPSGRYEKVNPTHSWNSDHSLSGYVLFNLSRHSDHHAYADRPYQKLRSFPESPQLPTGYPGMILMALVPPLFFKVMDPLVESASSSTATTLRS